MNILVAGDSYSYNDNSNTCYPKILTDKYNAHLINLSLPGSSLDYMFVSLSTYLASTTASIDVVIVTVTSGERLYHPDFKIHTSFSQLNNGNPLDSETLNAINKYYCYLHHGHTSAINVKKTQYALSFLTQMYPAIKFIILPCFDLWDTPLLLGNYAVTYPRLMDFSLLDKVAHQKEIQGIPAVRNNHLSNQQNRDLAEQLSNIIDTYATSCHTRVHLNLENIGDDL